MDLGTGARRVAAMKFKPASRRRLSIERNGEIDVDTEHATCVMFPRTEKPELAYPDVVHVLKPNGGFLGLHSDDI